VNFDALKAAHMNAMKYYGRGDAEGQMVFVAMGKEMASVFYGNDLSTGYVEQGDKKFYWEITPIEGGVKVYIKVNILGKIYEKTFVILFNGKEAVIKGEGDERYDWMCILKCAGSAAFKCLDCMTDWKCWAKCAGADVVSCVMGCF